MGFLLLCAVTFFSAFLLFQIELIIAKLFLPTYGGSYLVWGACVVFFQAVLLAGYIFAHYFIKRFNIRKYLKIHFVLLLLPFFFFPGKDIHIQAQAIALPLVLDIFIRLLTTIGPVFLTLATVSLVTQSWLKSSHLSQRSHPYVLYAVSNIGSFVALWTYPFIFEYALTNTEQLHIWRAIYVMVVIITFVAWKMVPVTNDEEDTSNVASVPITKAMAIRWLLLSAGAVMLFLSVTNIITYEVAPIPLLWIIPLSIYLLSFVLTFKKNPWFPRWMEIVSLIAFPAAVGLYFLIKVPMFPTVWAIILFNFLLFILCLHAQHQLIKSRPAGNGLTFFYVMISLGGFLGGFITSWIVPLISQSLVEFLLGLGLLAIAYSQRLTRIIAIILVVGAFIFDASVKAHPSLVKKRNYYGIYDVFDKPSGIRAFVHGTTLHGIEFYDPAKQYIPIGYYSPNSPMGEVFTKDIFSAKRVASIGLGAGTMAMFSKPDLPMDFFELDPDVFSIAKEYFWYLRLAPGPIRVAVGDARVTLSNISGPTYDIMTIDAFGGDSIPFHLINKDVVAFYRERLTEHGGILFHIPNRYFNLEPVLAHIALDLGGYAAMKEAKQDGITMRTFWAVMTWDQERYIRLVGQEGWRPLTVDQYKPMRTWTDDFSTALSILKTDELWAGLKYSGARK